MMMTSSAVCSVGRTLSLVSLIFVCCFVFSLSRDNNRGIAFEGALRYDMGNIEVADQQAAVRYFAGKGLIDATRVGMFGWSYGGYMSAMSMCRGDGTFACAVSGAPVTSWDGYDTHYTGTYLLGCLLLSDFPLLPSLLDDMGYQTHINIV
jgi:hypothetical protein